ncbi:MAG: hypothetical protein MUQ32_10940 [Chloroflexi bacterium]|nr:hypothetical protein [Chloroflexota bacterium]
MTGIDRSEGDRGLPAAVPETRDPVPAQLEPAGVTRSQWLPRRALLAAIVGVFILPVAVAAGLTFKAIPSDDRAANAAAARVVSAADMESEYGVRVNLVAVTAAGGLVDVRFTVVDKDKAEHIFHDAASMPDLLVEASGAVLSAPKPMAHKLVLLDGATYFILFPNSGGVIQAGTGVSVVVDGIRLEPIAAQS